MQVSLSNVSGRSKKSVVLLYCYMTVILLGSFLPTQVQAQAPTITSFTPATVCQGDVVTINGTNFTGTTVVKLGTVNAITFAVNTDGTMITAMVSNSSATGTVTVTNPAGTATGPGTLTIKPSPIPSLTDAGNPDGPFTNCNGNATYQLTVQNGSATYSTGNAYKIDWGDNTTAFTQTDWPYGTQTTHTYNAQGYFTVTMTITPANGCTRTVTYKFYNGQNPLASFTTTSSTTGLCVPASVEFQIGNWFNNSAGTTYQIDFGDGTANVVLQHPLNATNTTFLLSHIYNTSSCPGGVDFTATLKAINGCFTTTYTLNQIIIRKKPTADFSYLPIPACLTTPVCFTNLTANGFSGGNSCSIASTYLWDFGDGSTSTDANPPCHTYANAGTYPVTLKASNSTCGADTKTKQVIVLPTSPPPVAATPVIYCQGQPSVPLTATGTGLLWYTSPAGGTGSPTAPTPSTATAGSTTWYVSQTLTNECESPRVPVVVPVNARPGAPVVTTPVQLCQNQAATPLTASGTGLLWYTSPTGGTGSSTAPTPSTTTLGNTTYYVSQTTNSCEGSRASIVITVNALAIAPVVTSPITYCQNQTAVPLTASGTGLLWYTVPTGGTGSSTAPTPSTSTPGSITYYVSQVTGCGEGPRASITVNVNAGPSASIAYNPAIGCNVTNTTTTPNLPIPVILTGATAGSFSISPASGLPINATTGTIDPSGATAGTYTIKYTLPGTGGCSNLIATASVTVTGSPTATIAYPEICSSDAATNVKLTGTQGGIFSSTTGLTIDQSTGAITPAASTPGTYLVTYSIIAAPPCPAFTTTTNVTITQAPSAIISYNPAILCNVINSPSTPNLPLTASFTGTTGGVFSITPVTGLSIDPTTGTLTPSGATAGTYTVKYTIPSASGCAIVIATASVAVSGSPKAAITYPPICSSDAAANVKLTGTQGGIFTSTAGLTIDQATGSITPATSTPGTYLVTYTILPASPCPGITTTTSVTITQAPSAKIAYTPTALCNVTNTPATPNPPITPSLTGTTGGIFSISPVSGLSIDATAGTINPSGATTGTYTIKYTAPGTGGCSDYSTTVLLTVSDAPTATIHYPGSPYCRGINTPQKVAASGTPGGIFSAGPGLAINATTGDIDPAASTPGTYTITYKVAASFPCPGYSTTTTVEIDDSPVLTFPVAAQSICSGEIAVFTPSSSVANTTYTWSVTGPLPANIAGITSGTSADPLPAISLSFTNTGTISQSITVQVIPTNPSQHPCSGTPYTLTLTINPIPPAPAADTVTFCMGDPATALTITLLPGTSIKWYDNNFVLLSAAPTISTAVPAQFIYYASQSYSNGCESPKAKILVIVHPTAKIISSVSKNPTSCGIPSGSIVLNILDLNNNPLPNIPVLVHYDKFNVAYQVVESTDASGKITIPLTAGTYSGIYVETFGCPSQEIPDVFILKDPTPPPQPAAGYNPPLCSGTPLNLTALSAADPQAGAIDYVWAGPAFGAFADTVRNTVITFPSPDVDDGGTYAVYAIQNNCISATTDFQVTILQSPSKPLIATKTPLCIGDDLTLQAYSTIPGPNTELNYIWRGPGTGFPVNASNAGINNVNIEDGGIYSILVTSPATGCTATADTLIQIGGYPIVKFSADTLTLPTGYLLKLAPAITNEADPAILPIANFAWTPSQDLTCNDAVCSAPVATIKNNVCYTVKATNIYGCSGSDTICVKVFCQSSQIFIPNAFTPVGDVQANRILMVRASGISSVKSFRIFNRWGKIVFEKNNFPPNSPDFGWDGRINGKLADPGVYVYTAEVICENGIPYTFKGNVTLL